MELNFEELRRKAAEAGAEKVEQDKRFNRGQEIRAEEAARLRIEEAVEELKREPPKLVDAAVRYGHTHVDVNCGFTCGKQQYPVSMSNWLSHSHSWKCLDDVGKAKWAMLQEQGFAVCLEFKKHTFHRATTSSGGSYSSRDYRCTITARFPGQ